MVEGIEGFGDGFEVETLVEAEASAEACIQCEVIEAGSCVAIDDGSGENLRA